jgi:hypothetical protein
LAVDTTALAVTTGCSVAAIRSHLNRSSSWVMAQTEKATQVAQARCSEGMAAY